jgi:hypothetical protein
MQRKVPQRAPKRPTMELKEGTALLEERDGPEVEWKERPRCRKVT